MLPAIALVVLASVARAGSVVQEPDPAPPPGPDAPRCIAGACLGDLHARLADFARVDRIDLAPVADVAPPPGDASRDDAAEVAWRIVDRGDDSVLAPHTQATIATTTCYSPGASQRIDVPLLRGASEAEYFELLESYRVQFGAGRPRVAGLEHETWWRWSWPQSGTGLRLIRADDGTIVAVLFSTALAEQDDACGRHARRREHLRRGLLPM